MASIVDLISPFPSSGIRNVVETKRGGVMRKTLSALLTAASLGIAAVPSLPSPAEARWGWGWGWGGFGVGLATGAIIGGALARPYYPYYGYYGGYYAPAYYYPPYYGYGYYPRYYGYGYYPRY
jgi:hypothetical protein